MKLIHHGGAEGVTGSCHQLFINESESVLIDCGLFQGVEEERSTEENHGLGFAVTGIHALLITHCHIDHVGRIPDLIAAGFRGKVYATEATAKLLPLVLEDALKIGVTRNKRVIEGFLKLIDQLMVPVPYDQWIPLDFIKERIEAKFKKAGHILGSAYIEVRKACEKQFEKVVFSGDLGATYTPLLTSPKPPYSANILVLESTYGDSLHEGRKNRKKGLQGILTSSFKNGGTVLIPAFSIGRTQELLYEIEQIIHETREETVLGNITWDDLDVIVDSPLAAEFNQVYQDLKCFWDQEAKHKLERGRHPLSFEQVTTIQSHDQHLATIDYLKKSGRPAIVIAASGMCTGGRIVNYLKALLGDERTEILFVGYQANRTTGRMIQKYGPRKGYVMIDGERYDIKATVHTLSGYSAHADQANLLRFVSRIRKKPQEIRLVHGEREAQEALKKKINQLFPWIKVSHGKMWHDND